MSLAETLTFSFMVGAGIVIALVFLVSVFNTFEKLIALVSITIGILACTGIGYIVLNLFGIV
ncbi:hypothetical protein [Bacillus wiedmannii]|uniref:Uncharacterized protein n=1 Tax=Bacillus wiedmannii TaxID=1890302 RepID=A0A2B5I3S2_9BACI|nr:hypothetical protein [Bacillus wiedmannii]PFZ19514.1 hypothetical protein COL66_29130 [Bacillus wiedmannii]